MHGVRPWLCSGEPSGELVHGTGYQDRCGQWKNGRQWVRRYRDAKVHNGMSRRALRCRDAFHVLRDMSDACRYERVYMGCGPTTTDEAREQAVRVLIHLLNWLAAP